ncbi:hypothetical protein D1822_15205 [Phaeobacter inhibens]|uniref:hypothetical protein n=1 Tax=Phaeobacter inhibens TaxID=221822 RepID=UPI0001632F9A|nr:hypothetical protein [Phaeobacter inhibens]AFO92742.1 hypothetical protein PGA1_c30930 [Phaeobacter inhibens DSM 17395]AUQ47445.1 hypothetical protein PhaeoP10_03141 [Phaeobacter inhibens]AXT24049.1 hypothetical protein D1822_15205 [Phaeobacter inhibens]
MTQSVQTTHAATGSMRRRCALILEDVRKLGLLESKTESLTTRINPDLLRLAKERTGFEANSALIELALANLVVENGFPEAFARSRGRVSADLDLSV